MDKFGKYSSYLKNTKNIHRDDLHYIEKNLLFYEKVSVGFLLYGTDRVNSDLILQKLLVLNNNRSETSSILFDYTRVNPENWQACLIEALAIVKCNKVLKKLGFNISELRIIFLPHLPETSLFIHPILKALYAICDSLTPAEAGRLINDASQNNNTIRFYDPAFMEIFLLHWMTMSLIDIGKWQINYPTDITAINLDIILQFLKLNEKDHQKEILMCVINSLKNATTTIISNKNKNKQSVSHPITNNQQNQKDSANHHEPNDNFDKKGNSITIPVQDDDRYIIRKEAAGYILIINQNEFYEDSNPELKELLPPEKLKFRQGSDIDTQSLSVTFQQFGYDPCIKQNLTHIEIINAIHQIAVKSIVYDSVIICILSHGIEGIVYGANSIPVTIKEIDQTLANATGLLNKPKMILIQACQGPEMQIPKIVNPLEMDGPGKLQTVSGYCDVVKGISTVPGFVSIRHIEKGSWFIQTVCKEIERLGDRQHILDIMTHVTRNVSNKRGYENECMVPSITQTLTKSFYLPRRF